MIRLSLSLLCPTSRSPSPASRCSVLAVPPPENGNHQHPGRHPCPASTATASTDPIRLPRSQPQPRFSPVLGGLCVAVSRLPAGRNSSQPPTAVLRSSVTDFCLNPSISAVDAPLHTLNDPLHRSAVAVGGSVPNGRLFAPCPQASAIQRNDSSFPVSAHES
ncbi:hypothetical protein Cgig2_007143 [Carnegiea gigantea]|uniref:Uncharacterized protein n=1 Tax=Carnegiea gigantea TaxID=171969 RepID=A0A9Q1KN53_9CARY|nr:hypothetical protein Cgig2_007143 [Carnegiea gigantea]